MQKLGMIIISMCILFFTFLVGHASESTLNTEIKMKIENIVEKLISKTQKKYNIQKQGAIYQSFNDRILKMGEGMSGERLLVINYVGELIKSEINNLNKGNMKEIVINQGERKNIDDVLWIEYVDVDFPEGKTGYAGIKLNMAKSLYQEEFNLNLDIKNESIIWQGYKIIILHAKLYSPVKITVEKIDIIGNIKEKLLNFKEYSDDEINDALLELDKQEEPTIYSESLVDPDDSYHTYIESIYTNTGLTIYQYDGKVTNVEKIIK